MALEDTPSGRLLAQLASWGLPNGPTTALTVPADLDRVELADRIHYHRITGVALEAIADGAVDADDPELVELVSDRHHRLLRQSLLAEADLVRVARQLRAAGIDFRVVKGLATAHLDYPDPALRMTSDVDLLVRTDDFEAAQLALRELVDAAGSVPERRPGFDARFGKDRTLELLSGGALDLHRMIAPSYWGLSIDHDSLFDEADSYTVGGVDLQALSAANRFVNALLHAGYTDQLKLQSFRDVSVIAARLDTPIADVLAQSWLRPVRGLLDLGLARLDMMGINTPVAPSTNAPSRRERLALRTRSLDGSRDHWAGSLALPLHAWPAYLGPILFPSKEFLSWAGQTRSSRVRSIGPAITRRG